MRTYLFLIAILFSVSAVAQSNKEEKTEQSKKQRTNTNVSPAYSNEVESEADEAPKGSSFSDLNSSVVFDASVNIQKTFDEIKQMSNQKTPTSKQVQKLNYELIKIKNANQNAFEYYLYNYKIGNYDFERIDDLKMAAKLQPNHPEVLKSLSAFYYIQGNTTLLKQQLSKINSGKHFSSELSGFAKDVLESMPKNSILITHGEDDTYPLLIEQYINKTRQDVRVISLDHLQSEDFRNKLKKDGLIVPTGSKINTTFFKDFVNQNAKNIVVATSVPKSYLKTIHDKMHVDGLGFGITGNQQISTAKRQAELYDNTIKSVLQNKMKIKYDKLLPNYLPFLFEVRNYWIDKGNTAKIKEVEAVIIEIGKLSNKLEQVLQMLK